jgi:hypothetical protein
MQRGIPRIDTSTINEEPNHASFRSKIKTCLIDASKISDICGSNMSNINKNN